jgi:hypothetical protein
MKTILVLLALFLLVACSAPPTVTDTPAVTLTPAAPTNTPAVPTRTATVTFTPRAPTATPAGPTVSPDDKPFLPNPDWQPGVNNPNVTQDNIQTTICVSGYSSRIRPPVSYTDALKKQQIPQYGYADKNLANYEEDHLIALEDGGHPTDPMNLWPQPRHTQPWNASFKDTLENVLHGMVCAGQLPLATARQALATDWVAAYQKYVPNSIFALTPVPPEP